MKKWINTNTGEEFTGDSLGAISVSYSEDTNKTSFYLGSLDVVALTIDGVLDDIDVEQYIQDYLANWEVVDEIVTVEVTRKYNSGSHSFDLAYSSLEDAQSAITALKKSADIISASIKK